MNKSQIRDSSKQNILKSDSDPGNEYRDLDPVLSEEEYRKILNDNASSSDQIARRVMFLEAFCRKIIRLELEKYAKKC